MLVGLVLVLGCAAFFIGVIYLCCSFLGIVGRGVVSMFFPETRFARRRGLGRPNAVCPNPKCRAVERRPARYCAHCGTEMKA